ncbi:MAG: glycosyltransferase [Spirochaetaceae bacterium]|nr:glycosyltransferase [Spirochaetaceae bacterium]
MRAKALYLRGERVTEIRGGADQVSASILAMLRDYFEGEVEELYLDEPPGRAPSRFASLREALVLRFAPLGRAAAARLKERVKGKDFLFVDQSVYGRAVEDARVSEPACRSAVLFHNDERRFYIERAKKTGRWHNLLLLPAIERAERAAAGGAELLVALSARDARELAEDYGREPELVIPAVVADRRKESPERPDPDGADFSMLFAGSAFPPNLEGVRWFVREVMPLVTGRLVVVGRGFEEHRKELESDRVTVAGTVPDTAPYYAVADCVISPIFWGSGIKVKTAEAFMQGKTVVGTAEAFEGYDREAAGGILAQDAATFAAALSRLAANRREGAFSAKARAYYESALSYEAQYRRFSAAMDRLLGRAARQNPGPEAR